MLQRLSICAGGQVWIADTHLPGAETNRHLLRCEQFPDEKLSFPKTASGQTNSSRKLSSAEDRGVSAAGFDRPWFNVLGWGMGASCSLLPADFYSEVRKTASFWSVSLCLSRACLGKMIVFIYKRLKNAVVRRRCTPAMMAAVRNETKRDDLNFGWFSFPRQALDKRALRSKSR
jgi:hypothetical protein